MTTSAPSTQAAAAAEPDETSAGRGVSAKGVGSFLLAYVFWLVILVSILVAMWMSSSGLSGFRYAGF